MGIKLSGMVSGLDTDNIIKEMMKAQSLKKTKVEQKKVKLEWSQDKWKDLNSKIYNLYTSTLTSMRTEGTYQKKKVTSSNEAVLTATASNTAAVGSHTVEVKALASAQYLTSDKVLNEKGGAYKLTDKLTDLGMEVGTTIRIAIGVGNSAKVSTFEVTADSTIDSYTKALQNAGLNASYDTSQGRFFISSKQSGEANMFSIETINPRPLNDAKNRLESLITGESVISSFYSEYDAALAAFIQGADGSESQIEALNEKMDTIIANAVQSAVENEAREKVVRDKIDQLCENTSSTAYQSVAGGVNKMFFVDGDSEKGFNADVIAKIKEDYPDDADDDNFIEAEAWLRYNEAFDKTLREAAQLYADTDEGKEKIADIVATDEYQATVEEKKRIIEDALDVYVTAQKDVITGDVPKIADGGLDKLGISNIHIYDTSVEGAVNKTYSVSMSGNNAATLKQASDAVIILDDAEIKGTSNNFTVAGLTFDIKTVTRENEVININVSNDVSAVTDMVKKFVKDYNSILQSMNDMYFASLAKGYEPLTDEEKSAMSEGQIEMWENKIKDSLLRRDPTLRSILNTFRSITETKITVGDKAYSLSSFGITTSDYTEKGILHLFGDTSDSTFLNKEDLLTKMFTENPEEAGKAFSGIVRELYGTLTDKMTSNTLSSALSLYNDKQMSKQMDRYEKDIKNWQTKLDKIEDRYYKKFTAMEKALSTLNSQSNSLASLLGSNNSNS